MHGAGDLLRRALHGQSQEIREEMERLMKKSIRNAQIRGARYRIAFAQTLWVPGETAAGMRKRPLDDIERLILLRGGSPSGRFLPSAYPPLGSLVAGHPNAQRTFNFLVLGRRPLRCLGDPTISTGS
jgi:hypothetical protein